MGAPLRWIAGLVGLAGLARLLRRQGRTPTRLARPTPTPDAATTTADDDPAEVLRRKLAEARRSTPREPAPAGPDGTTAVEEAGPGEEAEGGAGEPPVSMEERRARIHARAQEAIDAMHGEGA